MLDSQSAETHRSWSGERGSADLERRRPGLASVTMRGRVESEAADYVISCFPWLLSPGPTEVFWDLSEVTSFSTLVPPIMVSGLIKHRALAGRLHMFTVSALLKATIIGSNLTLGSTMVHYGERAAFEAALAEALRR